MSIGATTIHRKASLRLAFLWCSPYSSHSMVYKPPYMTKSIHLSMRRC